MKVSSFPKCAGAWEYIEDLGSPLPETEQVTTSAQFDDDDLENQQIIEAGNSIIGDEGE